MRRGRSRNGERARGGAARAAATAIRLAAGACLGLALAACGGERVDLSQLERVTIPAEHQAGEALYQAGCEVCHGVRATGTQQGPPLVDWVYEPSHHGDAAFLLAVQRGVIAHHWRFGNMPPVPGMGEADVAQVVGYVRWLQRQVGIE
jgi:mono/diheme cytochrome c family protein